VEEAHARLLNRNFDLLGRRAQILNPQQRVLFALDASHDQSAGLKLALEVLVTSDFLHDLLPLELGDLLKTAAASAQEDVRQLQVVVLEGVLLGDHLEELEVVEEPEDRVRLSVDHHLAHAELSLRHFGGAVDPTQPEALCRLAPAGTAQQLLVLRVVAELVEVV